MISRQDDISELETSLRVTLSTAADRHAERHEQLMELLSANCIDWEAWDSLYVLQQADWLIIDGAQRQLRAIVHVPA